MPASTSKDPWSRPKLTIHLSAKRKARLAAISSLHGGSTPAAALDAAIEASLNSPASSDPLDASALSAFGDRLDAIETTLRQISDATLSAHAALELISAAASEMGSDGPTPSLDSDPAPPPIADLRSWLRQELSARRASPRKHVWIHAEWTGSIKASDRMARLRFDVWLAAIDGVRTDISRPSVQVELGLAALDGKLFQAVAASAGQPMILELSPDARSGGWKSSLRARGPDGSPSGAPLAAFQL